jgi:L-amino acid N-acyltransferase YncA
MPPLFVRRWAMTENEMRLRLMTPEDLNSLWPIFQEIIQEGSTYAHDETTTREEFAEYWNGRGGEQWVVHDGGRLLGSYTLRANQPGRGAHVATASYVVASHARGQGVGHGMGRHSIERAMALGFAAMQFNLVISTNDAAVRLWRRLEFEIIGTVPKAFRHATRGLVDAYVIFRSLARENDVQPRG